MRATLRPYVTAGVALVGATAIAVTPIAAAPPDVTIANPAVQLTASPFDAYEALFDNSGSNIEGLIALALAPVPTLPFTLDDLITQALEVDTNVAAFRALLSGLSGQVDSLNQLNRMFLQAASNELQAGNVEGALDVILYTALFSGTGLLGFALYPAALLGVDVEEVTPEFAGALLNAAVAPAFSGVAMGGHIAQDVLDAVRSGNYQDLPSELIAAPALLTNGVLNGAVLQTSIFGPVTIPGILTDTTLLDSEGPGPISLAIQLVQFTRGLLTPPAAAASTLNTTQETTRVKTFDLNLNRGFRTESVRPEISGSAKPSTVVSDVDDNGNVLNADKVTNSGADGASASTKNNRPRLIGASPSASHNVSGATGLQNLRQGVRNGLQGLRDSVRDAVKNLTGRDQTVGGRSVDNTGDAP